LTTYVAEAAMSPAIAGQRSGGSSRSVSAAVAASTTAVAGSSRLMRRA
jgi:hypothetical protein